MKLTTKNLTHFLLKGVMACAAALAGGNALAADAKPNAITAIDILLEPDATMIQHATATNDRLRKVFPKGFALDASHRPHITLVQRFVLTENLDKVYAAIGKVFASANVTGLKAGSRQILLHPGQGPRPLGHCHQTDSGIAQAGTAGD